MKKRLERWKNEKGEKKREKTREKGDEEEKDTREGKIRNCEKIQNRARRKREI